MMSVVPPPLWLFAWQVAAGDFYQYILLQPHRYNDLKISDLFTWKTEP